MWPKVNRFPQKLRKNKQKLHIGLTCVLDVITEFVQLRLSCSAVIRPALLLLLTRRLAWRLVQKLQGHVTHKKDDMFCRQRKKNKKG